jgi:sucrose phosphorylase
MSPSPHAERVRAHLVELYPDHDPDDLAPRVLAAIGITGEAEAPSAQPPRWDSADAVLITYADSIVAGGRVPLAVLGEVLSEVNHVLPIAHVLPFFPASSDRGFAVIDHAAVDDRLGGWADVDRLSGHSDLMVDLVCNHVSSKSEWFRQFLSDEDPGRHYVLTVPEGTDVSTVVRPRSRPLLEQVTTTAGDRLVWCTFGPDQVDLDYRNPQVLVEMLRFVDVYLDHGARLLRLDAIAYLWKEPGTPCIHLPATHEVVRLLRTLLDVRSPRACIVTETNVPDEENRSYFGIGDEAHVVYNFALPPLLVHALLTGRTDLLGSWLAQGRRPPDGCTFLNFVASHDGIGLRPAEGLLGPDDVDALVAVTERRGGFWSSYDSWQAPSPPAMTISWSSASSALTPSSWGWPAYRRST